MYADQPDMLHNLNQVMQLCTHLAQLLYTQNILEFLFCSVVEEYLTMGSQFFLQANYHRSRELLAGENREQNLW